MTDELDWKWKLGVLHGFGECFWQEGGGKIRRISRLFVGPDGNLGMAKSVLGGMMRGFEEIPIGDLVVMSAGASSEQQVSCNQLWSGIIKPANGVPRFKLEK